VIDIGCAEGYYAAGLALRLNRALIHCFEIDPVAKKLCRRLAKLNEISDRVAIEGRCTVEKLRELLSRRTLIVCDCEGFEWELLHPDHLPELTQVDIIVELHGYDEATAKHTWESRFKASHDTVFVTAHSRSAEEMDLVALKGWSAEERRLASNEFRNDGYLWAWAKARV